MNKLQIDQMKVWVADGLTCTDIANLSGATVSAVYGFCKRNQLGIAKAKRGGNNVKDLTGKEFGSLTVLRRAGSREKLATWECECDCGRTVTYTGADLRQGKATTCGCKKGRKNKRNWQGEGEIPRSYWSSLTFNAEKRKIPLDTCIKEAHSLWVSQNRMCKLTKLPISFADHTASLDRKDNSLGYVKGNIQWVHKDVNKLKGTFDQNRLVELCLLITQTIGDTNVARKSIR